MPQLSQERSDARRASILQAARKLLVARGYQDFVLDDLARKAGVAKGTLFLYFKTKDELLSSTFGDLVDQLGAKLDSLRQSGLEGEALLKEAIRCVLAHFDQNSDFLSQFGAGRFPSCGDRSCDRLMEKFRRNLGSMAALLERAETRKLKFAEPRALAAVLFGLCRSALLYKKLSGLKGPLEDRAGWVLERFLYGACGRKP